MRSFALAGALTVSLLVLVVAGCGGGSTAKDMTDAQEVFLQPVADQGPNPFTGSTATSDATPARPPGPAGSPPPAATGQAVRTVIGSTAGLYGGTRSLGSCDIEQQVSLLSTDQDKARAFARASDSSEESVPAYLRALTPVHLRADVRVTGHRYRDGAATPYQAVLQAGTAVLVDAHGMPRVRCACGNPLLPPATARGATVYRGPTWTGYRPAQVVVIKPAARMINSLVIVNVTDQTWIERKTGDDGAQDKPAQVLPPYDPDDGFPTDQPETFTEEPAVPQQSEQQGQQEQPVQPVQPDVPTEAVPTENVPTEDVPTEDVPTEDVPTEDLPADPADPADPGYPYLQPEEAETAYGEVFQEEA
ncbi:hypothetical protein NLX86_08825 [Streptomyces sp. A3M-1-3]|uniref:DUF6777 domain-containing protein n=1 Tax=Streptomyces sp. A3M-1-3 TaxID=2962044 RepID=UPI0020B70C2C|nr:DUF6777 domain-containing protein [Streptomyces sp. A3M-1-3]MCP3818214.1 hypothetical protein [Streptomyces sp. A3M-1-3]